MTFSLEWLPYITALLHLAACPFTKVEESFNLQACHDIIYHNTDLDQYDHLEFPGVVPRTFLGPFFVSAMAYPLLFLSTFMEGTKFISQFIVRCVLAMVVLGSLQNLREAVRAKFGPQTALWHLIITTSQFHIMFYASRPLPNIFALALTMYAFASWLRGNRERFIVTSAFVILVFRGELALLLGPILLMDLAVGKVGLLLTFRYGLAATLVSLVATIGVDSVMWRQDWLWPEGNVLYYNIILNKSSNWGTSPWPWYFYSALPRALFATTVFVPLGVLMDRRVFLLVFPCLTFVTLYSFLPHKELRFIMYVFPILNIAAAEACKRLWEGAMNKPSILRKIGAAVAVLHIVANWAFTAVMLYISSQNYPGGVAIMRLHQMESPEEPVNLHIDVFSAQTGVSRFTQLHKNWIYSKAEDLPLDKLSEFSHLLVESRDLQTLEGLSKSHDVIDSISAFSGLSYVNLNTFPPLKANFSPAVSILRKKGNASLQK